MRPSLVPLLLLNGGCYAQTIWDVWETSWNQDYLFTSLKPSGISFNSPGAIGDANIVVDDSTIYQQMDGFGAALTDTSALVLNNLKNSNSSGYWSLLYKLFDPTEGQPSAALSVLRLPIGASDFSASAYSLDDVPNDYSLASFNINNAPAYVFSTLADIKTVNPYLKLIMTPWSAPAWMKNSSSLFGGGLTPGYETLYAQYLFKAVQGLAAKNFTPYAVSCQNEPGNENPTYPTMLLPVDQEALVGKALRPLLNSGGFGNVKIIGYDHNWDDAGTYPVTLMSEASSAFVGAAFHCYAGSVQNQQIFTNAWPNKEVYFTECTGTIGSDWWSDIKWNMANLLQGSTEYSARTVLFWNLVTQADGNPKLPGTNSCGGSGCRPVVSVDNSAWHLNQEFYLLAHSSRIVTPRDTGGQFASRIGVGVNGTLNWSLVVQAYITPRLSPTDWQKIGLVVLNWYDNASSTFNPIPVNTTIAFRGMQARYTFPVGMTTLWWYAPPESYGGDGWIETGQSPQGS